MDRESKIRANAGRRELSPWELMLIQQERTKKAAQRHAADLEQGSLLVNAPQLKRAMTDAAAFLREQFPPE